jgi:glyoxylase-like metal-dependent hydrolase (beta-lactamase superfamily II)
VLRTDEGAVAFDTSGKRSAAAVVDAIAGWSDVPVTHIVYTHGHIDHVGGSGAFAERWSEPTVYGHANVAPRFDRYELTNDWNVDINARQFGGIRLVVGMMAPSTTAAPAATGRHFLPTNVLRPSVEVGDHGEFDLGGETVELHHARGETDDHLWAWLPGRKTIMAGDFLIWNFPNAGNPQKVQRYPIDWAAAIR